MTAIKTMFTHLNELIAPSLERQIGYFNWLRSEEGRKWVEDMKIRETQLRRICHEQNSRCLRLHRSSLGRL